MSKRTSRQIRQDFFDFFKEKEHLTVESVPVVPMDDPTLLFINAGMNPFKPIFLGEHEGFERSGKEWKRVANTQKCIRVSGKHNDLEEVGHDTYHHTLFEMLGNWSFGDYFKKEAIAWAWELLVDRWGLEPDRLYATVFIGDGEDGLPADDEAAALWASQTSIPVNHILKFGKKDNFWEMGETGPCGPCSEVHIDLRSDEERKKVDGATLVNKDDPRVMEIWNLVFIQFNRLKDGSLNPLPARHVDTGMGFERIAAVLQGKKSNYDTDVFTPLLDAISRRARIAYGASEKTDIAMRVVADHIRAVSFAIADGVTPSNEDRGYVIRRILRRASRYAWDRLEIREAFMGELVDVLSVQFRDIFPELSEKAKHVKKVITAEEHSFLRTLEQGIAYFDEMIGKMMAGTGGHPRDQGKASPESQSAEAGGRSSEAKSAEAGGRSSEAKSAHKAESAPETKSSKGGESSSDGVSPVRPQLSGEDAFKLHDTYGFPIDLTELMARERGISVDMDGFQMRMQEQKDRARKAGKFKAGDGEAEGTGPVFKVPAGKETVFTGYDETETSCTILDVGEWNKEPVLLLDRTPFYAESGGQVADTGVIRNTKTGETVKVTDVQHIAGHRVHFTDRKPGGVGGEWMASVDADRRAETERHHTATHLLHAALREILGEHVAQRGSLVAPDRLRFDFSHYEPVTPEQLNAIEERVNEKIRQNVQLREERSIPIQQAKERGAMMLFGEKYGDHVRMITFDPDYSVELCGGTHVDATGSIGYLRILHESSVAAGIRRIEAVSGSVADRYLREEKNLINRIRREIGKGDQPDVEVIRLIEEKKLLEKELEKLGRLAAGLRLDELLAQSEKTGRGITLVAGEVEGSDMNTLKQLGYDALQKAGKNTVIVLGSRDDEKGKVYLMAAVTEDVIAEGVKAGALVGVLAKTVGGGGGGQPNLATAGGRQPEKLSLVFKQAMEELS